MYQAEGVTGISLLEFTTAISNHVNSNPDLKNRWVIAELSDFRMHGPHAYGQLIEKDQAGRTVATLRATIWSSTLSHITHKFEYATGNRLTTGMKVMLRLSASHSPAYGLSANVTDIDPSYTLGDMERLRREILDKIRQEGIYDANRSLDLPLNPQRIAVISASGAAGYGDFLNQLRSSGYAFYPGLFEAKMQGGMTVPTVLNALRRIEETEDFWDCVVMIRGGGATSDLNSFDNLELARRVATFPIPVIVGIGHERDNTVLDYLAHTRCKTPTAVAAFLIERLQQAETRAEDLTRGIADYTRRVLGAEQQRIAHISAMLPVLAPSLLQREGHRLERLSTEVGRIANANISRANSRLGDLAIAIGRSSTTLITASRGRLESLPRIISGLVTQRMLIEAGKLESTGKLIAVLNPDSTLRRGYSITRIGGRAVRSAKDIKPGTILETRLPDGTIISKTV